MQHICFCRVYFLLVGEFPELATKSAKHCYVCDTYGCLGSTALPEQKFADFFTNSIRTFLTYICQISFTLLRVFYSGRGNNNRLLFNSSFTHIFHPVGFPLTDKSFLGKKNNYSDSLYCMEKVVLFVVLYKTLCSLKSY